jgi:hypothetical protein
MEDTDSTKATAEVRTPDREFAVLTDGSTVENGRMGCAAVW